MTQESKINSSFAEFLEEKAALAFISFSSLFGLLAIEKQKSRIERMRMPLHLMNSSIIR